MKANRIPASPRSCRPLAIGAALLLQIAPVSAQSIPNPSFEANSFATSPGYVSDNGPITGWSGSPDINVGLNPPAGQAYYRVVVPLQ